MTQTTDQDRAEFEQIMRGSQSYKPELLKWIGDRYEFDTMESAWRGFQLGKQAASRAPAPVLREPTSKQIVLGAGALLGQPEHTADNRHPEWHSAVEKVRKVYLAMLAAAQPTQPSSPHGTDTILRSKFV